MPATPCHHARFTALDHLLHRHRPLWQVRPFQVRDLCWRHSHPDLCAALEELDENTLTALESSQAARWRWLRPWLGDDLEALQELTCLEALPTRPLAPPSRFETGIPGRKWQQVLAFAAAIAADSQPLLEWCAGKGHLGRLLARTDGRQVTSLELDQTLCEAGLGAAQQWRVQQRFVQGDALAPDSGRWLAATGQVVALHACGDLHTTLVKRWAASDCPRISLSPCCYHLTAHREYRPLSTPAGASTLGLEKIDLALAVRETVTGGSGASRRRHIEVLWRLAFDEWQRHRRGVDQYLPLPAFPKRLLSGTFTDFCRHAATCRGLAPPTTLDEKHWLAQGARRATLVRRTELISQRFRRPLEIWLALDAALFLEEQGATVRLGTFCDKPLTPRNILIDGVRRH